jgi:glycosyltransferase involved in cell wall biosynthesis
MRVCLIAVELFAWGKYGGYGRATRMLGRELVKRGISVCAVVPKRDGQQDVEELDGIQVLGFPMTAPWKARRLFEACNADIYHSQEPSLSTWLAQKAMPRRKHLVTFRDPKTARDRFIEGRYPSIHTLKTAAAAWYEGSGLVKKAAQRADGRFVCVNGLAEKAQAVYGLTEAPALLASPIPIPDRPMRKDSRPTVCFLARWDKRKRPEFFFELAREFPQVRFIAVGRGQNQRVERELRSRYGALPNVEMRGFVDQFASDELSQILEQSWILVNTSAREGLPTSFLEAMAHRCALLSGVNPDTVAARFGYHAKEADFAEGLRRLLENDAWKAKGEAGFAYVNEHHALEKVVESHINIYRSFVGR